MNDRIIISDKSFMLTITKYRDVARFEAIRTCDESVKVRDEMPLCYIKSFDDLVLFCKANSELLDIDNSDEFVDKIISSKTELIGFVNNMKVAYFDIKEEIRIEHREMKLRMVCHYNPRGELENSWLNPCKPCGFIGVNNTCPKAGYYWVEYRSYYDITPRGIWARYKDGHDHFLKIFNIDMSSDIYQEVLWFINRAIGYVNGSIKMKAYGFSDESPSSAVTNESLAEKLHGCIETIEW